MKKTTTKRIEREVPLQSDDDSRKNKGLSTVKIIGSSTLERSRNFDSHTIEGQKLEDVTKKDPWNRGAKKDLHTLEVSVGGVCRYLLRWSSFASFVGESKGKIVWSRLFELPR